MSNNLGRGLCYLRSRRKTYRKTLEGISTRLALQRNIGDCNVSTSIVHIQGAVKCLLHYFLFVQRHNIEEKD